MGRVERLLGTSYHRNVTSFQIGTAADRTAVREKTMVSSVDQLLMGGSKQTISCITESGPDELVQVELAVQ